MNRRHLIALCAALACATPLAGLAQSAANFPDKPIRLVMPFPPGGSTDVAARIIGPLMAEKLGQQVVIDNKPGAGGAIALDIVARAAPDGYTLAVGTTGGLGVGKVLGINQPYDAFRDFAPIGVLVTSTFLVIASQDSGIGSLTQMRAQAQVRPGGLSMGHGGNGSVMHLSSELIKQMGNINLAMVPYRGTAPATMDAVSGQIPLAMSDIPAALAHVKSGKLRAVGVTGLHRSLALPEVPTLAEQGLAGYEALGWMGIVAPAKTPPEVVARLNAALNAALANPAARERLIALGVDPGGGTPAEMGHLMRTEYDKWAKVIKVGNIKAE